MLIIYLAGNFMRNFSYTNHFLEEIHIFEDTREKRYDSTIFTFQRAKQGKPSKSFEDEG